MRRQVASPVRRAAARRPPAERPAPAPRRRPSALSSAQSIHVVARWSQRASAVSHLPVTRDQISSPTPRSCFAGSIRKRPARPVAGSWLPLVVRTGSGVGVDEGGCSPTRATARARLQVVAVRPAASTPATPAIAAKEGSRRSRSQCRTVEGIEMRTSGDMQVSRLARVDTRFRWVPLLRALSGGLLDRQR